MYIQEGEPYENRSEKSMEARPADSSSSSEAESEHESDLVETSRDAFRTTVQGQHGHDAQRIQHVISHIEALPKVSQFTFAPAHQPRGSSASMPMAARRK